MASELAMKAAEAIARNEGWLPTDDPTSLADIIDSHGVLVSHEDAELLRQVKRLRNIIENHPDGFSVSDLSFVSTKGHPAEFEVELYAQEGGEDDGGEWFADGKSVDFTEAIRIACDRAAPEEVQP